MQHFSLLVTKIWWPNSAILAVWQFHSWVFECLAVSLLGVRISAVSLLGVRISAVSLLGVRVFGSFTPGFHSWVFEFRQFHSWVSLLGV